ncbi:MAG TPA: C4-type zinc ribbon domain-containing protein [Acidobacteriaceae bacterium]|nr:C4-type zinc ribbon domain-containing protein [Acidobacteriaceae bacterium]
MNDELFALVQLQDTDQNISRLRAEIAALPKQLAALEEKLIWQRARADQATKAIREEETKRRRLESDLKDVQQKIAKFREQSSSVKTNEQFHALQHEVGFAEEEIRKIEDRELESMERSEALEKQLKAAQQELADNLKVVEIEKESARKATEELQKRLTALQGDRARLREQISEGNLASYDRIASSRGTALARVDGQRCLACQMALRPQLWNEVRGGKLTPCESCGRLLYFDSEKPPEPDALPATLKNKAAAEA